MNSSSKPYLVLILVISIFLQLSLITPTSAQIQANLQHTLTNTAKVYGAVWSPDGNRVITWTEDKQAVIWDANTGSQLFSITHGGLFTLYRSPLYSPDGKFIVSFQDKTLWIWDAENGSQLHELEAINDINGILWNNAGTVIAIWSNFSSSLTTGFEGIIEIWKANDGTRITTLGQENSYLQSIQFSPDDSLIATLSTGDMGGIRIWNISDSHEISIMRQGGSLFGGWGGVEWNDELGQISFSGINGIAFTANVTTGEHITDFQNYGWISRTFWSPDKSRVMGVLLNNRVLPIWDATSGDLVQSIRHTDYVTAATWSNNSLRILSSSTNGYDRGSINIWDAQTGVKLLDLPHASRAPSAQWNATESLLLGWFQNTFNADQSGDFKIWDTTTGAEILSGKSQGLLSPVWSPDGNRLLSWQENQAFIWKFE